MGQGCYRGCQSSTQRMTGGSAAGNSPSKRRQHDAQSNSSGDSAPVSRSTTLSRSGMQSASFATNPPVLLLEAAKGKPIKRDLSEWTKERVRAKVLAKYQSGTPKIGASPVAFPADRKEEALLDDKDVVVSVTAVTAHTSPGGGGPISGPGGSGSPYSPALTRAIERAISNAFQQFLTIPSSQAPLCADDLGLHCAVRYVGDEFLRLECGLPHAASALVAAYLGPYPEHAFLDVPVAPMRAVAKRTQEATTFMNSLSALLYERFNEQLVARSAAAKVSLHVTPTEIELQFKDGQEHIFTPPVILLRELLCVRRGKRAFLFEDFHSEEECPSNQCLSLMGGPFKTSRRLQSINRWAYQWDLKFSSKETRDNVAAAVTVLVNAARGKHYLTLLRQVTWKRFIEKDRGVPYYYNEHTGATSWEVPPGNIITVDTEESPHAEDHSQSQDSTAWDQDAKQDE